MTKYYYDKGKLVPIAPELYPEESMVAPRRMPALSKASDFTGPSERTIPFNERDLVPANEIRSASNAYQWGNIASGTAKGIAGALKNANDIAMAKEEMKEEKRRRLAQLLSRSRNRDSQFADLLAEHGDQTKDYQSQAIQDVARGFAETFRR